MKTLSIGATGMLAQQLNVDVISNNIANMSTIGFKRQLAQFADLGYQHIVRPGVNSSESGNVIPTGVSIGNGVKPMGVYRIHEQGQVQVTSNQLDTMINGEGFFQIQLPNGSVGYTRAGSFQSNAEGQIVTAEGYPVLPNITIPASTTELTINAEGTVFAKIDGQGALQNLGQFQLATFLNPAGLEATGNNLYLETPASGAAVTGVANATGFGKVVQGSLETSNVNVVSEITTLITAQRAYEMNSKVIRTADDMMNTVNQLR